MTSFFRFANITRWQNLISTCADNPGDQQHVLLRRESQSYRWSIRNNNIVLIAHRIFINLGYVDYFQWIWKFKTYSTKIMYIAFTIKQCFMPSKCNLQLQFSFTYILQSILIWRHFFALQTLPLATVEIILFCDFITRIIRACANEILPSSNVCKAKKWRHIRIDCNIYVKLNCNWRLHLLAMCN
jgi:hypothetical protein